MVMGMGVVLFLIGKHFHIIYFNYVSLSPIPPRSSSPPHIPNFIFSLFQNKQTKKETEKHKNENKKTSKGPIR